jgi:hypothetical protein
VWLRHVAHLKNFRPAERLLYHCSAHDHPNTAPAPRIRRSSRVVEPASVRPK